MTVEQTTDLDAMTAIMMTPEVREPLKLPEGFHFSWMYKETSIYLLFKDSAGNDVGFIWWDDTEEGWLSHIMMTNACRGHNALKAIRAAINWFFTKTENEHIMAAPPFKHSYLLVKMLGFYDIREETVTVPVMGTLKRNVVRLDRAAWFKKLLYTPFFVTGYPRSGTAWISNLLTCTPALCSHEGSGLGPAIGLWLYGDKYRGLSDSMVLRTLPRLIADNPDSPVVYLKRDKEEAFASFLRWMTKEISLKDGDREKIYETFTDLERRFEVLEARPNTLVVDFREFPKKAKEIWEHCLPNLPFDSTRAQFLQALNVQQNLAHILANGIPNPIEYPETNLLPPPAENIL